MAIQVKPVEYQVIVLTGALSDLCLATPEAAVAAGAKVVLSARSVATLQEIAECPVPITQRSRTRRLIHIDRQESVHIRV